MQARLPARLCPGPGLDLKASALFSALPFATMALGSLVSGHFGNSLTTDIIVRGAQARRAVVGRAGSHY